MDSVCLDACLSHDGMYGPSRTEIGAMWGKRHICKTGPNKGFQIPNMQPEANPPSLERKCRGAAGQCTIISTGFQSSMGAQSLRDHFLGLAESRDRYPLSLPL